MTQPLRYPYSFEERKPLFVSPVLFVPEFYEEAQNSMHRDFFDPDWESVLHHPKVHIEYCCGNGDWLVENAFRYPDAQWIGVDLKFDRVHKTYKKILKYELKNCFVVLGRAEIFTEYYLKPKSVQQVFVNFPDPWPKKKHAKNRLLKSEFLDSVNPILASGGSITFVTDDMPYLEEGVDVMKKAGLKAAFEAPHFTPLTPDYGPSFFEKLWSSKGKTNYLTRFITP